MNQSIQDKIDFWLNSNIDSADKEKIRSLIDDQNEEELVDAFYKDMEFGTGGLRGIMGIGSNRMNQYTVGMATQGLSNYLMKQFPKEEISVAIAYDCRNNSSLFAQVAANIFSANDIKVYLFEALRPTPELSFAIRKLRCKSGLVITASHNPKEYNGYKTYWSDGAQITPPHDQNIIHEVQSIVSFDQIKFEPNKGLIQSVGAEMDEQYLDAVASLCQSTDAIARQSDLSIVYSPIHGTGITMVPPVLKKIGFKNVHVIQEQAQPNGDFPTVIYPNPEEKEALTFALKKAEEIDAELVLATDPDADRVGIAIKNSEGAFELLNGNQTGVLIMYYQCLMWQKHGRLDGNQYLVKTIVTTELIREIATHFGVDCHDTLTGFKWIASLIAQLEGTKMFIAGGEESYGYMIGDQVRDKDAIASCAVIAEMAGWAKDKNQSLFELLEEIYSQFGLYQESLVSITKHGKTGAEEIQAIMTNFRNQPPATLGGSQLIKIIDYQNTTEKELPSGKVTSIDFPASNVLQFITQDGSKISIRPSGTEPKIKFYFSVRSKYDGDKNLKQERNILQKKIGSIQEELNLK